MRKYKEKTTKPHVTTKITFESFDNIFMIFGYICIIILQIIYFSKHKIVYSGYLDNFNILLL